MPVRRLTVKCLPPALALLLLMILYLTTLQTIPNGSSHYFMIDVGETQIVLNEWGSLHPTGYPLYVISGNVLTGILCALNVGPLVAAALVSLLWGALALLLMFILATRLGFTPWLAAGAILLYGLTRTVWIHNVIAEIYSFNLLQLMLLLHLTFTHFARDRHLFLLALAGGVALGHHRAFLTLIPPLLYALWPVIRNSGQRPSRLVFAGSLLAAASLVPNLWPLLRARSGADWVYGSPQTFPELADIIVASEYSRFIGPPASLPDLLHNLQQVNDAILQELSLPGVLLGGAGLLLASRAGRRSGRTFLLVALCAWLFHAGFYRDILSALVLPITLALAFGWLYLADALQKTRIVPASWPFAVASAVLVSLILLWRHNQPFVQQLTRDPTGLETIDALEAAPPGSTVMLAWGPRYFAASAAQLYLGRLQEITLVDHNADMRAAFQANRLVTPDYTFFNQPPNWWEERLGQAVWLDGAGPRLVRLRPAPVIVETGNLKIVDLETRPHCSSGELVLEVLWNAGANPPRQDLSVFVKAFAANGEMLVQGDQIGPLYGLRPTSKWLGNEQLRDFYPVRIPPDMVRRVDYGLYRAIPGGEFENVLERTLQPECQVEDG
ncbi:MAG: DUF2723 domain-containing protein [Anaerolineaceae bacterium]|nr:DUF2723 domain-containing protein [Anaerolineaceae bacterium]